MNDSFLRFSPVIPLWLISLAFVVVVSISIYIEYKRIVPFKALRIAAVTILLLSLLILFLRTTYKAEGTETSVILLTPGYKTSVVDSIINRNKNLTILHTSEANPYKNSSAVHSYHSLKNIENKLRFVVGEGLPASAIESISNKNYTFIQSDYPEGMIDLQQSKQYQRNKASEVQGVFNCKTEQTKIILHSAKGKEDSIIFSKTGMQPFTLHFTPKQAGKFLYRLSIQAKEEVTETLPIEVIEDKSLNILILQQYPTFEVQYLKQYLSAKHKVIIRSQVSRSQFHFEYINQPEKPINPLRPSLLNTFDLVIMDTDALQSLSNSDLSNLKESIQEGLGVLVLFNDKPVTTRRLKDLIEADFKSDKKDSVALNVHDKKIIVSTWPVNVSGERALPVIKQSNKIICGYEFHGLGKSGFQLASNTYAFTLAGDSVTYSHLWSDLIEKISRSKNQIPSIKIKSSPPYYADEPIDIDIIGSPKLLFNDSIEMPVQENENIAELYHTRIWPKQTGWNKLSVSDSLSLNFYISEQTAWPSLRTSKTIDENKQLSNNTQHSISLIIMYKSIPQLLLLITVLLSGAILWLLPKLSTQRKLLS